MGLGGFRVSSVAGGVGQHEVGQLRNSEDAQGPKNRGGNIKGADGDHRL